MMTPRSVVAGIGAFLDLLLPRCCVLCRQSVARLEAVAPASMRRPAALCDYCLTELPGYRRRRCRVCALPLPGSRGNPADDICASCALAPPAFDATWVLADYAMPIDRLIHVCKYRNKPQLAHAMGHALAEQATIALPAWPTVVMAVPLAVARLRSRGYNQALLIARAIGACWQAPIDASSLIRVRSTLIQRDLPLSERHDNMAAAFSCTARLDGARIALVDDVMTTGLTLHWAASALREAGAASIVCLAVARTPPPGKITA